MHAKLSSIPQENTRFLSLSRLGDARPPVDFSMEATTSAFNINDTTFPLADEVEFWKAQCHKKNSEIVNLKGQKRIAEEHAADLVVVLEKMVRKLESVAGQLARLNEGREWDAK